MRFKLKRRGLLNDSKRSFMADFKSVSVEKYGLESEDIIRVCFKGKKDSGVIEIKRDELEHILNLSR